MQKKSSSHTFDLKDSRQSAEREVESYKAQGWEVFHEKIPLTGQIGFYCVREYTTPEGTQGKETHSIRWNQFERELEPVTINCYRKTVLFQYLLRHARHNVYVFNYSDGDLGFVCYCHAKNGWSEVLRVSDSEPVDFDDDTYEILWEYSNKADSEIPDW